MSLKKILMTASALALLSGSAFADGGPVPEEPPAPPPEPVAPPPEEEPYDPPPAPEAAPAPVWYIGGHGGIVWADDFEFETAFDLIQTDLDSGWGAGGAIGYRWADGWRGELEATYRRNDGVIFDSFELFDTEVDSFSIMVNVLYDFDIESFLVPYVGAGIGGSHVTVSIDDPAGSEDDGWGFAYQFIAGFSIPMPNSAFELFADYRYLSTTGLKLEFDGFVEHNDEYHTHNVMGGIRFNF